MLTYQAVQSNKITFVLNHRFILNKHHISNLQKVFTLAHQLNWCYTGYYLLCLYGQQRESCGVWVGGGGGVIEYPVLQHLTYVLKMEFLCFP